MDLSETCLTCYVSELLFQDSLGSKQKIIWFDTKLSQTVIFTMENPIHEILELCQNKCKQM